MPRSSPPMRLRVAHVGALALFALLGACSAPQSSKQSALAFTDCRLKHLETQARCATMEVPEDHAKPDGAKIKIHVALIPALTRFPEKDPVLFFAGGPGQAASEIGGTIGSMFTLRRNRDLLLIDQRGTGKSKTLTCEAGSLEADKKNPRDALVEAFNASTTQIQAEWKRCIDTLKGNAATHRTDDYIADLELVRKTLGYDKINVWGGSYGSRVALRYMKLHPSVIRSAVLDGIAPTTLRLPNDALINSDAQLRALTAACAQSSDCAKAFPTLEKSLDALLTTLKANPKTVTINHPADGKPFNATITDVSFSMMIWPMLYAPETSRMVPALIEQANAGNFAPFAAMMSANDSSDTTMAIAQRVAVMCAEDMSGQAPIVSDRFGSVAAMFFDFCKGFPHGKVAPEFFEPTKSDIPTLILSGTLDPVTPPSQGDLVAKTLANSKHITVAGLGHIVSPHSCVRRIIRKFVESGLIAEANDSCESELKLPRPLFYVNALEAK
ncbi:MAG: alpha/beta fold hydrolase [Casimicrobium sp.]